MVHSVGWDDSLSCGCHSNTGRRFFCLASKSGPPRGRWGHEKLSPSFGQPCFPEAIGGGMQKELCPSRGGCMMKWCKSNGWTYLWSLETCPAFGCISFPLTLLYVQKKRRVRVSLVSESLIQDLFSCSQRQKANALSHFNTLCSSNLRIIFTVQLFCQLFPPF